MNKFTSSGTLANLQSTSNTVVADDGIFSWTQTRDEVEIQIKVLENIKAKDIKVVFKTNSLLISFPTEIGSETSHKYLHVLQTAPGGELFSKINVDESSWSLDGAGDKRLLTITLAKHVDLLQWLTLLKE
jgi:hypothetical protein